MTLSEILLFILLVLIIIFLIIACFTVWASKPNRFRMFEIPAVYAHRGLHNDSGAPENSLAAFKNAHEKNLAVELDVHRTKDGKLVVVHDSNLNRLCKKDGIVEDMDYDEFKNFKLCGTNQTIPTFQEVLDVCDGIPILCEIKTPDTDTFEDLCKDVYAMISKYNGQIVIESFNPYVLHWFRENAPEIIRGQLSNSYREFKKYNSGFEFRLAANLLFNFLSRPDFISYKYDEESIGLALNRIFGTRLVAWTVKSMDEVQIAANNGFSSFIGEDFDLTEV